MKHNNYLNMNTQIYLWIEPLVMHHERCTDKVYFNCIVEGNHTTSEKRELEDLIEGEKMDAIMDFAGIDCNWNYGVISATTTTKKPIIEYAPSLEKVVKEKAKKKEEAKITRILNSKKPLSLSKENVEIKDGGKIEVSLPALNVNQEIDFAKIWLSLEKEVIGKIKEGDEVTLTDDDGNVLFEMIGGNFLNVGLADMSIYDKETIDKKRSILNHYQGLKGGLFVREDGSIDIGDAKRTFWLKIYTNKLLKAALKVNKTLNEMLKINYEVPPNQ